MHIHVLSIASGTIFVCERKKGEAEIKFWHIILWVKWVEKVLYRKCILCFQSLCRLCSLAFLILNNVNGNSGCLKLISSENRAKEAIILYDFKINNHSINDKREQYMNNMGNLKQSHWQSANILSRHLKPCNWTIMMTTAHDCFAVQFIIIEWWVYESETKSVFSVLINRDVEWIRLVLMSLS